MNSPEEIHLNWLAELRQVGDYGEIRRVSGPEAERAVAVTAAFISDSSLY